jgi:hypothetical protein
MKAQAAFLGMFRDVQGRQNATWSPPESRRCSPKRGGRSDRGGGRTRAGWHY